MCPICPPLAPALPTYGLMCRKGPEFFSFILSCFNEAIKRINYMVPLYIHYTILAEIRKSIGTLLFFFIERIVLYFEVPSKGIIIE